MALKKRGKFKLANCQVHSIHFANPTLAAEENEHINAFLDFCGNHERVLMSEFSWPRAMLLMFSI